MPDCYLYHPNEIPIHIIPESLQTNCEIEPQPALCRGGLRCNSDIFVAPDTQISLRVCLDEYGVTTTGLVLWCQRLGERYLLSIGFTDKETVFKVRMIEQACEIECYRRRQQRCGRLLSSGQAAKEWIEKYAADFPHLGRLQ